MHPQAVAADDQEEKARWIQAHRSYKAGVASLAATTQLTHDFIEAVIKDPNAWVAMGQNGTVRTSMISTGVRRTRESKMRTRVFARTREGLGALQPPGKPFGTFITACC